MNPDVVPLVSVITDLQYLHSGVHLFFLASTLKHLKAYDTTTGIVVSEIDDELVVSPADIAIKHTFAQNKQAIRKYSKVNTLK